MKTCTKCKETKDFSMFHKNKARLDGHRSQCVACQRAARDVGKKREYDRAYQLSRKYGLTPECFDRMMAEQSNCCAICQREFTKTPHVDHCHKSGEVRGLLCSNCNRAIGFLGDDPLTVSRAVDYLERTHI